MQQNLAVDQHFHSHQQINPSLSAHPLPGASEEPELKLYCICRTADESKPMIECEKCEEWYHFECVNLTVSHFSYESVNLSR